MFLKIRFMVIYSFNFSIIKRSAGMSAIKVAANVAGEKLYDETLDKTFNFTGKRDGIIKKGIVLPTQAPKWMIDREKLWNYVESCEKRKDSQLARKFGMALPNEFTAKVNIELSQVFINQQFISLGMVADYCIFYSKKGTDPYLTVLTTTREITESGFGQKMEELRKKELHLKWREEWANILNKYLIYNGHSNQKVTHKSLASQGVELLPQGKSAPIGSRDRLTEMVGREEEKIKLNEQRILKNPDVLLLAISKQYSEFGENILDGFIRRNTLSNESFALIKSLIEKSGNLVLVSKSNENKKRFTIKKGEM
jgi:ATP-dependent exoDNAse (exonuclease V) alpha subunit